MSGMKNILHDLTGLAVFLVAVLSLGAWLADWHPYLEITSHFRVQYFWGAVLALLFALGLRRFILALLAFLLISINSIYLLPWYLPPEELPPTSQLRILLANVHTDNPHHQALLDLIATESPDVLILQETDAAWFQALSVLDQTYPFWDGEARDDNFGMMVFSRVPLLDLSLQDWGQEWRYPPSLEARIEICQQEIALLATHPTPPVGEYLSELRSEQLALIAEHVAAWQIPGLIVGDLNVTPWSPLYSQLLTTTGYANARRGFGILPSWTTALPMPLRLPLDHVLHHPNLRIKNMRLGNDIGSDHLPVLVDIAIPDC